MIVKFGVLFVDQALIIHPSIQFFKISTKKKSLQEFCCSQPHFWYSTFQPFWISRFSPGFPFWFLGLNLLWIRNHSDFWICFCCEFTTILNSRFDFVVNSQPLWILDLIWLWIHNHSEFWMILLWIHNHPDFWIGFCCEFTTIL